MTARQSQLLAYLRECQASGGPMPSCREMAAFMGVRSLNAVNKFLESLEAAGHIVRPKPKRARGIVVRTLAPAELSWCEAWASLIRHLMAVDAIRPVNVSDFHV